MPGSEKIRIYTLQDIGAWEAAQKRGYWTGDRDYILTDRELEYSWVPQYDWMRRQMAKRIPGYSGDYPIWAYFYRHNMRQHPFQEDPTVMLVADIPRERMVVSDYGLWHMPLNEGFVSFSEAEDDALDDAHKAAGHRRRQITPEKEENWERVLRIEKHEDPAVLDWIGRKDIFQTCIDRVYLDEIVSVTRQQGRKGRNGGNTY